MDVVDPGNHREHLFPQGGHLHLLQRTVVSEIINTKSRGLIPYPPPVPPLRHRHS
jgi:hypothetical protein